MYNLRLILILNVTEVIYVIVIIHFTIAYCWEGKCWRETDCLKLAEETLYGCVIAERFCFNSRLVGSCHWWHQNSEAGQSKEKVRQIWLMLQWMKISTRLFIKCVIYDDKKVSRFFYIKALNAFFFFKCQFNQFAIKKVWPFSCLSSLIFCRKLVLGGCVGVQKVLVLEML